MLPDHAMPEQPTRMREASARDSSRSGDRAGTRSAAGQGAARPDRRRLLALMAGTTALGLTGWAGPGRAQDAGGAEAGTPFSFEALIETMRQRAAEPYAAPAKAEGFFTALDYDDYQRIQFDPDRARWGDGEGGRFRVNAFHLGWLFEEPVALHEVRDGQARPMHFSTDDFLYHEPLELEIPEHREMPGVAGVRLNAPLNRADIHDEVVAFLGASYFRALGRGNRYGLSARGLAVNTGLPEGEEFPRFEAFWLERPDPHATGTVICAALSSPSVTGAFRFTVMPGDPTRMDVETHLFLREEVAQLGLAPLTSMFLFGGADRGGFDDFRPAVHDSEALLMEAGGQRIWRPLKNPSRLANSYFEADNPRAFGLVQRSRDFDDYLDAQARYDLRPSLVIRPRGEWGSGKLRLVEIPTERETNDNVVAFWVPEGGFAAGQEISLSYTMEWGEGPGEDSPDLAIVRRSSAGHGGVAGLEPAEDRRKFVIDFEGGLLGELPDDAEVAPVVRVNGGEAHEVVLSRVEGLRSWRLVIELAPGSEEIAEITAHLEGYGQVLSETWAYQWMRDA